MTSREVEKAEMDATMNRALTRCRCGRFGIRANGFCSLECAAEHAEPAAVAPSTAATPGANIEESELDAFAERIREIDDQAMRDRAAARAARVAP
jgi:hypothetical protein